MRSFVINKNRCIYYWLRKRRGLSVANTFEKTILVFGKGSSTIQNPMKTGTIVSFPNPASFEMDINNGSFDKT